MGVRSPTISCDLEFDSNPHPSIQFKKRVMSEDIILQPTYWKGGTIRKGSTSILEQSSSHWVLNKSYGLRGPRHLRFFGVLLAIKDSNKLAAVHVIIHWMVGIDVIAKYDIEIERQDMDSLRGWGKRTCDYFSILTVLHSFFTIREMVPTQSPTLKPYCDGTKSISQVVNRYQGLHFFVQTDFQLSRG
jgi:hypothetical protein